MATISEVLDGHGFGVSEDELARDFEVAVANRLPRPGVAPLSRDTQRVLEEGGLDFSATAPLAAIRRSAAGYAALVATAVPVGVVAAEIGVDASLLRRWIAQHKLYTVRPGRAHLVPRFQLEGLAPLPGLGVVLRALPAEMHPVAVEGFFAAPQPELELDGRMMSPRDWLLARGDPGAVAALAASLDAA